MTYRYEEFEYTEKEIADTYLNNYGMCSLGPKCLCLKPENPWLGQGCFYWTPFGFKNFKEHQKWFLEHFGNPVKKDP